MRKLLKPMHQVLLWTHLLSYKGESDETAGVDASGIGPREGKGRADELAAAPGNPLSGDAGFLMDFLSADLGSPFNSGRFFGEARSGGDVWGAA
jgi:hypothetical protein